MAMGQPASDAFAITPHDTIDLRQPASYLRVGGDGDLKIKTLKGQAITIKNCLAGEWIWCAALRVYDTGTTATDIMGFV